MIRYVWDMYNTKFERGDIPQISELVRTMEFELESSSDPILPETCPFVRTNNDQLVILCDTPDYQDASFVSPNEYFGLVDPDGEEPAKTYLTHSEVRTLDKIEEEDAAPIYRIVSVTTSTTEADTLSVIIVYKIFENVEGDIIVKGDSRIGSRSATYRECYMDSAYRLDGVSEPVWMEYAGADTIDFGPDSISFSSKTVPPEGGVVTASIPNILSDASYLGNVLTCDWSYSTDGGLMWIPYASSFRQSTFALNIPESTVEFKLKVVLRDDVGFTSEPIISSSSVTISDIQKPSTPEFLDLPTAVVVGKPFAIVWSRSIDPEGDTIYGYVLEKRVNRGDWEVLIVGNQQSATDIASNDENEIQYRIKSYNSKMIYSEETVSDIITTKIHGRPTNTMVVNGTNYTKNENLGKIDGLTVTYTPYKYDASDTTDQLTVIEVLDNTTLNQYKTPGNISHTIQLVGTTWDDIADGTHVLTISIQDNYGESVVRSVVFKKLSKSDLLDDVRYQLMQKQPNGTYKILRIENDSDNVIRIGEQYTVEESLDLFLPEFRKNDSLPTDIGTGKFIIGNTKVFVRTADGNILVLNEQKPPYIAQDTPPSDTDILWIDTSNGSNTALLRYWNGYMWERLKSVYSGGVLD